MFVVSVAEGDATSVALLTPNPPMPSLTIFPEFQAVRVGSSAMITVLASGSSPLAYQWYMDTNAIVGATNAAFTIAHTTFRQSGQYHVVVSNPYGSTPSDIATIDVVTPGRNPRGRP